MALRLIFINRYYWPDESATSLMLTDLTRALAAAGHEVCVLTSRQQLEQPDAKLPASEYQRGVHIRRMWTTRFGRQRLVTRALDYLSFYLSAYLHLLWHLRRGDLVIAKTDPPLISVVAMVAASMKGARLINWLQDVYPEIAFRLGAVQKNSLLGKVLVALRNASLRRATANVAVGERMKGFIQTQVKGCAPVRVIHNWSQPLNATPAPEHSNRYRQQLGLQSKVVFGYSGNLGRAHDFAAILEAADRLRSHSAIHFLIVGGGAQLEAVRGEVRQRKLTNFSFLPYQPREQLAESLGAVDVHLVSLNPALEGLIVPSKIYGVMAAGRACIFIGDTAGEVAAILQSSGSGVTTAPPDVLGLADAMERLAGDASLRHAMAARAKAASASRYHAEHAIASWRQMLEDL